MPVNLLIVGPFLLNHYCNPPDLVICTRTPEASPWGVPTPKSVYLGSRMPEEDKQPILEICRRKGIDVHQMYLADDSFRLHSKLVVSAGS
jgi:hypothetical protein